MAVPRQVRSGRRWAFDDASSSAVMLSVYATNRIVSESLNSKGYCQVYRSKMNVALKMYGHYGRLIYLNVLAFVWMNKPHKNELLISKEGGILL